MKNTLNKIIAVIAMLSMFTSVTGCGTTVQTENSSETVRGEMTQTMPAPFSDGSDIGGDEHSSFYQPCRGTLDNIPVELMRLRDETEVSSWIDSFTPIDTTAPDSITEYANIFSFISNFNITKDEAESALSVYLNTDDEQIKITHDELDLILSGDIKAITTEFASDYSIVSGENIYAPSWYTSIQQMIITQPELPQLTLLKKPNFTQRWVSQTVLKLLSKPNYPNS